MAFDLRFVRSPLSRNASFAIGLFALSSPAFAFTPSGDPVADAFLTMIDGPDRIIRSYEDVEVSGDTIIIEKIVFAPKNDDTTVEIATTTLENARLADKDMFEADEISLETIHAENPKGAFDLSSVVITEASFPIDRNTPQAANDTSRVARYKTATLSDISIANEDTTATVERVYVELDNFKNNLATTSQVFVDKIHLPLKDAPMDQANQIKALGYDELNANLRMFASYDEDESTLTLDELTLNADDLGQLRLSLKFLGVTPDIMSGMARGSSNPADNPEWLQTLSFSDLQLDFTDGGVTKRALQAQADASGSTPDAVIQQTEFMLPMMLSMLQNEAFTASVQEAVGSFLRDPQKLTVTAAKDKPVGFMEVIGLALMAPQTIPTALQVTVSANQ